MASRHRDPPSTSSSLTAIGASSTAVAVFESTKPMAAVMKKSTVIMIGITVISSAIVFLGNLCANLLYPLIDPRIKETWS